VNWIRPLQLVVVVTAAAVLAPVAHAGSRCTDDPERCVERGASVSRPATKSVASAPAIKAQAASTAPARRAIAMRKVAPKPARVQPAPSTAPAPTPGMSMLLKLSNGTGGEVSWTPGGRPVENTGASWIL
jgi:hypothetical protein